MATLKNTDINDTGYLALPVGTSFDRPENPVQGDLRWNTTESIVEFYDGTDWYEWASPV